MKNKYLEVGKIVGYTKANISYLVHKILKEIDFGFKKLVDCEHLVQETCDNFINQESARKETIKILKEKVDSLSEMELLALAKELTKES